jgi:UDP-glucose 4-epimerase
VGRIAVTGTGSFLGARALRWLVKSRGADAVVAVDTARPPATLAGLRYRALDLTGSQSDQVLLETLREEDVECLVHLAFFTNPRRDRVRAHELESLGTLNLLAAAAAAGVERVLIRSSTALYGAKPGGPELLTEDDPLRPNLSLAWARDKLEAEQHAAAFARRYPGMTICVLRLAPLFGPGVHNFYTSIFDRRLVPVLTGVDPLVQLLHPEDALLALGAALERPFRGAVNIVPSGAIGLGAALQLAGKVRLPVPPRIAHMASELLWALGLAEANGAFLDYVRYPFVADGARAQRELGFTSRHTSRDALLAYLQDAQRSRRKRR